MSETISNSLQMQKGAPVENLAKADEMFDYAVVGSGIGGSSIAAYLQAKGFKTILFEREPYLGGCSSTYMHHGYRYNTGATTFVGYQEGHPVKNIFDAIGFFPDLLPIDPAITVIHNGKITPRYRNLDQFIQALQSNYPHPEHESFWHLVHSINRSFFELNGYHYSNRSLFKKLSSLLSYLPFVLKFRKYLQGDALTFIQNTYKDLSDEYLQFLEAQVFIVAQAPLGEINFFTAAIALGYTFNAAYYLPGGMSRLFDQLTAPIGEVKRSTLVKKITRLPDRYLLTTRNRHYEAKNVILNSTIYDSHKLFQDEEIEAYYQPYQKLDNHQSSFVLYMTIKSDTEFEHHYQIIRDTPYPFTISNSLFVSFSDKNDRLFTPKGYYSITASIHTDTRFWEDKQNYGKQKESLKNELMRTLCDTLSIKTEEIKDQFAGTPRTFADYLNRSQLGGNAITIKNFLPKLPSNDTPIEGLYHVGDTVYAAQGWPGVMLGVENLRRLLRV